MSKKVATMKVGGGADYAKVNARMLEFRKDCPNGKIDANPEYVVFDGVRYIQFKALIVKDKSDATSAEASGHARLPDDTKQKTFEKCETIAVGRALAFLGYGADGEIASSEEMEEFLADKQEKLAEAIFECTEAIGNCESVASLKSYWTSLSAELINHKTLIEAKNAKYKELMSVKDVV